MADNQDDGVMEFYYQFSSAHPAITVSLSPQSALPEVFEAFEGFLRAAGYHFEGQLVITNDAQENAELN